MATESWKGVNMAIWGIDKDLNQAYARFDEDYKDEKFSPLLRILILVGVIAVGAVLLVKIIFAIISWF